jgi:hypothetical protein
MYHPYCPCGEHVRLRLGVSCAMIMVPGGAMGALLYSYCPSKCVAGDIFGFILYVRSMLSVRIACGSNLSHRCIGKPYLWSIIRISNDL